MPSHPFGRSAAELLAAVARRKHEALRRELGIPEGARISEIELESLVYLLKARSGKLSVKIEEGVLRVGDPKSPGRIAFRGDAMGVLLSAWSLTQGQAEAGIEIAVKDGKRIDPL